MFLVLTNIHRDPIYNHPFICRPRREASMISAAKWSLRAPIMMAICTLVSGGGLAAHEIEGRWETKAKDLVLDISRCGEHYCGQAVNSSNTCGRTILTVGHNATSQTFDGELVVSGRALPYKVKVSTTRAADAAPGKMTIVGDDVDPSLARRTFPFRALLARTGDAVCPSKPTS
jgi:uncharacterized protein (DUF2147 family)